MAFRCPGAFPILVLLRRALRTPDFARACPGRHAIFGWYDHMWQALSPWVASRIFHVTGRSATYFPTGSGDTTLAYVLSYGFANGIVRFANAEPAAGHIDRNFGPAVGVIAGVLLDLVYAVHSRRSRLLLVRLPCPTDRE